ncbi:hypothetical protein E4631_07045 [Hymenobacter sp. UV11]|uniref:hypothetical protein n=1 Tax=Hymenobacter sp. UV11 TaxID=1849735 RepID=UPI00105E493A|nr:hypothetical protein [Hymenobacter sp. UV11]TDN37160.1 hypothetical protein A8B98_05390 [Hymenobacter sp. UV11]TFZ67722.1 hypothetical protein E4631_07045 [Hymenobacter sp. UV11]
MNKLLYASILLAASLSGCQHDSDSPAPALSDELAGTWRLTNLQCFCPAGQPVPNEVLMLDTSQHFKLFRNGTLAAAGTYATSQGANCSANDMVPFITLTASAANVYVPKGAYSLANNTLVIDQCSAADGPRYTYQRQ